MLEGAIRPLFSRLKEMLPSTRDLGDVEGHRAVFLKYLDYTSGFGGDLTARAVAGKDCQTVLDHDRGTCLPFINPTYVLPLF